MAVAPGPCAGIAGPDDHSEARQGRAPRGGGLLFFSVLYRWKLTRDSIPMSAKFTLPADRERPACLR